MIIVNPDFTFTQVKSDNPRIFAWHKRTVAEVAEMTAQFQTEDKSIASAVTKHEGKLDERKVRLDDLLVSAVDETLKQVFKEEGAKVIYEFIENKCRLKREEIAGKAEDFSAGLERLLGSAAPVIEKFILENLYSKLRLKYEETEGYSFRDYINELRHGQFDKKCDLRR